MINEFLFSLNKEARLQDTALFPSRSVFPFNSTAAEVKATLSADFRGLLWYVLTSQREDGSENQVEPVFQGEKHHKGIQTKTLDEDVQMGPGLVLTEVTLRVGSDTVEVQHYLSYLILAIIELLYFTKAFQYALFKVELSSFRSLKTGSKTFLW